MRGARLVCAIGACSLVMLPHAFSQSDSSGENIESSIRRAVQFFAPFVFPKIIQDGYRLKEYIVSDELAESRRRDGDALAVDAIFERAVDLSWGNRYEALLLAFVATMDHRRFGMKVPLLGPILWAPLTSEFPEDFQRRIRALPSRLYADTPREGDRDKLQHFFGSAFLTYVFESTEVADRFGTFVEKGEDAFIVGGVLDDRDFRANRQGAAFGLRLLQDESARPSLFLSPALLAPGTAADVLDNFPCGMEER